ncbi:MAG: hypothetical protein GEU79_11530 [Acidimicrobiia bacterium]|nr:hypothetical protein [Acidimicrobiia bacterium]
MRYFFVKALLGIGVCLGCALLILARFFLSNVMMGMVLGFLDGALIGWLMSPSAATASHLHHRPTDEEADR